MSAVLRVSLSALRRLSAEEIMRRYATHTTQIFQSAHQAVPVIIPSRNEEADIPACLVALSRSVHAVLPVVVVNCSRDRTAERAARMGAIVTEINGVKKMGATQEGLRTVLASRPELAQTHGVILFTDADTLLPRHWSLIMAHRLKAAAERHAQHGAAIFGSSIYMHGPSKFADIAQSIYGFSLDVWRAVRGDMPLIRGHNYGIAFGTQPTIQATMAGLNPLQMYRDDVTIYQSLRAAGVHTLRCLDPRTIALTRGDRAHSFEEFMKNLYKPGYEQSTYDKQYDISGCAKQPAQTVGGELGDKP